MYVCMYCNFKPSRKRVTSRLVQVLRVFKIQSRVWKPGEAMKLYVIVEGECFLCCCLYWTLNNFIVSDHIELASVFLSICLYRAESSIAGSVQERVFVFISRTSRANPVFRSSISNWRFSRVAPVSEQNWTNAFASRTTAANPVFKFSVPAKHKSNLSGTGLNERVHNEISVFTLTLPIISNWQFDRAAIHCKTLDL